MHIKKIVFFTLLSFILSGTINAQKEKGHKINMGKVEHVAEVNTKELDRIVSLGGKNQRTIIKKIYTQHELKKQKLLKPPVNKNGKGRYTYIRSDKNKSVQTEDQLNIQLNKKIDQQLTTAQKKKLVAHRKKENKPVQF